MKHKNFFDAETFLGNVEEYTKKLEGYLDHTPRVEEEAKGILISNIGAICKWMKGKKLKVYLSEQSTEPLGKLTHLGLSSKGRDVRVHISFDVTTPERRDSLTAVFKEARGTEKPSSAFESVFLKCHNKKVKFKDFLSKQVRYGKKTFKEFYPPDWICENHSSLQTEIENQLGKDKVAENIYNNMKGIAKWMSELHKPLNVYVYVGTEWKDLGQLTHLWFRGGEEKQLSFGVTDRSVTALREVIQDELDSEKKNSKDGFDVARFAPKSSIPKLSMHDYGITSEVRRGTANYSPPSLDTVSRVMLKKTQEELLTGKPTDTFYSLLVEDDIVEKVLQEEGATVAVKAASPPERGDLIAIWTETAMQDCRNRSSCAFLGIVSNCVKLSTPSEYALAFCERHRACGAQIEHEYKEDDAVFLNVIHKSFVNDSRAHCLQKVEEKDVSEKLIEFLCKKAADLEENPREKFVEAKLLKELKRHAESHYKIDDQVRIDEHNRMDIYCEPKPTKKDLRPVIIELKRCSRAREAVGQVMMYSHRMKRQLKRRNPNVKTPKCIVFLFDCGNVAGQCSERKKWRECISEFIAPMPREGDENGSEEEKLIQVECACLINELKSADREGKNGTVMNRILRRSMYVDDDEPAS